MKTEIIEKSIYKFEELTEDAKQQAIDKWYDEEEYNLQGEQFTDFAEELLLLLGFEGVKISYSLSSCQGDGFSFTCDKMYDDNVYNFLMMVLNKQPKENGYIFLIELLEKLNKMLLSYVNVENINKEILSQFEFYTEFRKISHHYSHERTVSVDCDYLTEDYDENELQENDKNTFEQIENFLKQAYLTICQTLEKEGYEQIYYKMDESEFKDLCDANDYEFLADGTLF